MASSNVSSARHRKLALIIGNGNYNRSENRLNHSIENVRVLSDSLKAIGFKVTTACDLKKHEMTTTIIDFSKTVGAGDLVFFYFSGHGYQVKGKNYLIPIGDAQIERNRDLEDFAVNFERILERLVERNPSYVNVFILDCCGTYLLKSTVASNSTAETKGLHEIKSTDGAFIQFACAANETVRDNLFGKHLLKNIAQENVNIVDVFRQIENDVYQESNKKQRPLSINGLRQHGEVYLNQQATILSTQQFLSEKPLTSEEETFYEECKEYYRITEQPLISFSEEIFDNKIELTSSSVKFGIDENCNKFELQTFMDKLCSKLNLKPNEIVIKKIQQGSTILEAEIYNKFESTDKKLSLKMIYKSLTEKLKRELAKMKIFFMFMGPIKSLFKKQKCRAEIKLNPEYNRKYMRGCDFWEGAIKDGKDRGNRPYYCPVGWQRWSFYVTDNFDAKFHGWCIGYHGTKFEYGLSILLTGLKTAEKAVHGAGIYLTPSINYACHPRYSEVKLIQQSYRNKIFKSGKYVQFVLECRVHPSNMKIAPETLGAGSTTIDSNITNDIIEWVVDNQKKSIVDFDDPDSSIVCTGILMRVTDEHPGLLPESEWWFKSHLCNYTKCCLLGTNLDSLKSQWHSGDNCNIIYD